jgi:hypothetical protein
MGKAIDEVCVVTAVRICTTIGADGQSHRDKQQATSTEGNLDTQAFSVY